MRLPYKSLEKKLFANGYHKIVAVDEAGVGALAGPVVACAVLFNKNFFKKSHKNLHWLRDSKLLNSHQREKFVKELLKIPDFKFRISFCQPKTIDRLNIYQAARLAMRRAINRLSRESEVRNYTKKNHNFIILIDGKTPIKGLPFKQIPIIKGDRKIFSIACASIMAKVFRDKMMTKYAKRFPNYGFEKNKGYGTKFHLLKLNNYGPIFIHRKSFAPIARLL